LTLLPGLSYATVSYATGALLERARGTNVIDRPGRYVVVGISGAGTEIVATKPARPGGTIRTVGFGCAIDPANETFPLTPPPEVCAATYTETKVSVGSATNAWFAPEGANVTFASFIGGRLTGSFSLALDPLTGNASPPITIEGTFDVKVQIQ
jgi:hypothetical protein